MDLYLGAHVHYYERMGPIKDGKLAPFSTAPWLTPEEDPNFKYIVVEKNSPPVYIVEGLPGNA